MSKVKEDIQRREEEASRGFLAGAAITAILLPVLLILLIVIK